MPKVRSSSTHAQINVALAAAIAGLAVACIKSKPVQSNVQDTLTQEMTPHNFVTDGYAVLNGGWSGVDLKGHILPDDRYGKENFLNFDLAQKQLHHFALDSEARNGILPEPTPEDPVKAEAALAELVRTEANINSANALISWMRLGALAKDYTVGVPKQLSSAFTIVTNRDELPYSPKPNAGPEWNQFIRDYCGGFQNPNLGFLWLDGSRKYCLKIWAGSSRQLLRFRALVSLPRSRTSSVLESRVSPWITLTRSVSKLTTTPTEIPAATEPTATGEQPSKVK